MDELKALETMGLVLPSPTYLLGAILFGMVGLLAFKRGRKLSRSALTWSGLALMLYPYAISQTWLLWGIGVGLTCWALSQWN